MADNKDEISCPACGTVMNKVYINSIGKNVDICLKHCGGIYFDNREFEKVDEAHECVDEILQLYNIYLIAIKISIIILYQFVITLKLNI